VPRRAFHLWLKAKSPKCKSIHRNSKILPDFTLSMEPWLFETNLSNILIESTRDLISDYDGKFPAGVKRVVKDLKERTNLRITDHEEFTSEERSLGKKIIDRWLSALKTGDRSEKRPKIKFGQFPEGTPCAWPGDCIAQSPSESEKDFVSRFHQILILRDLFTIQDDHLVADRWGGNKMIPICALHNRQKQDAMWPAILIDKEEI